MSKNNTTIDGKYLLAAKETASKDETRPILCGIHVCTDKSGKWQVESTDSYRVVRISNGYVGGKNAERDFVMPLDVLTGVKNTDVLAFEPSDDGTLTVTKYSKGTVTESKHRGIEGKYPTIDTLIPKDPIPRACYRYAMEFNPSFMVGLMKAAERVFGKGKAVELATLEGEERRPIVGYAKEEGIELTMLLMPTKHDDKHTMLGKPANAEGAALRKELKEAKANADMWKRNCLKAEEAQAQLEGQVVELRAKLDDAAKAEPKPEAPKPPKPEKKEPTPKPKAAKAKKDEPKAEEKAEVVASEVTLATMAEWCEGKGLTAKQKRDGCPVWVLGKSKAYKEELMAMGFRWGKSKDFGKGWYLRIA